MKTINNKYLFIIINLIFQSVLGDQTQDCVPFGNSCLSQQQIDECNEQNAEFIQGNVIDMEVQQVGEQVQVNFIQYNRQQINPECLQFSIGIQNNLLQSNEYTQQDQTTQILLNYNNMLNFECLKVDSGTETDFQCEYNLYYTFAGIPQKRYIFITTAKFNSSQKLIDVVDINFPTRNGKQILNLENKYEVKSVLKYCKNIKCAKHMPDNIIIDKEQDLYLKHSIVSPEFQRYTMLPGQITIDNYVFPILDVYKNHFQIVYKIRPSFSIGQHTIQATSRLYDAYNQFGGRQDGEEIEDYDNFGNTRRNLGQFIHLGDNYGVQAEQFIVIQDMTEMSNPYESSDKFSFWSAGLIIFFAIVIFFIVVYIVYYQRSKKQEQENKKPQQQKDIEKQQKDIQQIQNQQQQVICDQLQQQYKEDDLQSQDLQKLSLKNGISKLQRKESEIPLGEVSPTLNISPSPYKDDNGGKFIYPDCNI